MNERINKGFMQIFKSTFDFISSGSNPNEDNTKEKDIVDEINENVELESDPISGESDLNLIDIDALMAEHSLPEEDNFIEIKYIDVFTRNRFDADQPIEQKQVVMRELFLRNEVQLLPETNLLNLMTDEELDLFLKRFQPQELLLILRVCPQLKTKICELMVSQPFLWFTTDWKRGRFAPHEDCCHLCDHIIDMNESCIRVVDNKTLFNVLEAFFGVTNVFSSLKCLRLFRFVINEDSDEMLAKMCPNLLHLDLTECKVSHWKHLSAKHESLHHLNLNSTQINDQIFSAFVQKKRSLKTLLVNTTNITGKDLPLLQSEIERLDIRCCHQLFPNYIKEFNDFASDQLKYLRLEVVFDDESFALMCSAFPNLILLELRVSNRENTRLFTSNGLKQISKLSNLRSLKFGPNIAAHPIPLMDIFIGCPLIISFSIDGSDCYVRIDEGVLSQMANYWPLLRKLEFKSVDCIEKKTIDGLTRLQNLSYLDLTESPFLEDNCLIDNIGKMSGLNYLVLDKCHRLTILTYNAVIEKAQAMDSVLSASFFRCNFFIDYIKMDVLPKNLRLTFASTKSKRFMTWDGIRVKILRCEHIHQYFNEK